MLLLFCLTKIYSNNNNENDKIIDKVLTEVLGIATVYRFQDKLIIY